MNIVDSHQHFWDPVELELPPIPSEAAILDKAYLPKDLEPELRRAKVDCTVLVQGYPQSDQGNRWLFACAGETSFVAGVVAWVALLEPDVAAQQLDKLQTEPKFVGVRHIVEDEPDDRWILRDSVLKSLGELARRGIPYDMLVTPRHLSGVLAVLEKIPDLKTVIDHIGKPDIAKARFHGWADDMRALADHPQVYCKLSGMITEADWTHWRPGDLSRYVEHILEVCGCERVMFGSDWPVCLLAGSYQQVWEAEQEMVSHLNPKEKGRVFGKNAIDFYNLYCSR